MTDTITLAETLEADLEALFEFQLDKEAAYMAAFMSENSTDKAAYLAKYTRFLHDPSINMRTVRVNSEIVGSVAKLILDNEAEITYWIDRKFWGQGVATAALRDFLKIEQARPMRGRVAYDNYGSQKVLEKCGFVKIGTDKGFASARQMETEEFIYQLT